MVSTCLQALDPLRNKPTLLSRSILRGSWLPEQQNHPQKGPTNNQLRVPVSEEQAVKSVTLKERVHTSPRSHGLLLGDHTSLRSHDLQLTN